MPLPDFLILGAQKAGSTWLQERLREHPEIFLPEREVHYFDKADRLGRGPDWYRSFFDAAAPGQLVGEKTPEYFWTGTDGAEGHLGEVHRHVHELLPDARLLVSLRDPVERAISALNHLFRTGRLSPARDADALLVGELRSLIEPHGVLDYGRYAKHLDAYRSLYDPDQIRILIFEEDVVEDPRGGLQKAVRFLGADPTFAFPGLEIASNRPPASLLGLYLRYYFPWARRGIQVLDRLIGSPGFKLRPSRAAIEELYAFYEEPNRRLFEMLGREIPAWTCPTQA